MLVATLLSNGVRSQSSSNYPIGWRFGETTVYVPGAVVSIHFKSRIIRPQFASSDVSRHSEISIQCYLRTEQPKVGSDGLADDMGNDIFMGGIKFTPDFDNIGVVGQDQWHDVTGGKGKIQIGVAYQASSVSGFLFRVSSYE
jgi:hypothetical protein